MKIGDKIKFFLFGVEETGTVYKINKKDNTVSVMFEGFNYPDVETFKKLPKKKSDIPPWYILK